MTDMKLAPAGLSCIPIPAELGNGAGPREPQLMPTENGRFTSTEFREALERAGETQSSFADLLQLLGDPAANKVRTVQRWASSEQDIPGTVGVLLNLLDAMREKAGIDTDLVRSWFEPAQVIDPARVTPPLPQHRAVAVTVSSDSSASLTVGSRK